MEDKELLLSRAKNAVISRDFSVALRLYSQLLREEPDNETYLEAMGNIYVKGGEDQKALPFFEHILEKNPVSFNALNNVGSIYRRLGLYDEAIIVLNKALSLNKNNSVINYNLGFTYKSMGSLEKAIDCFENVIEENPQDVLAYNHLGSIYASKGDYTKAISTYKLGLQVDQNHPVIQFNLAKAYEAIHDDGNAVSAYEAALRSKPGWVDAVKGYGHMLVSHRRTKAASEVIKNALSLYPQNADLHLLKGNIEMLQCNHEAAVETLKKAQKLSPENPEVLESLANAYARNGNKKEAQETIKQAVKIWDPEDKLHIQKQEIGVYLSSGRLDEALEKIKEASTDENKQDVGLINLAGQFYILTKKDDSLELCREKINKFDPNYDDYLADWGYRYSQAGENEKSRESFVKYLENHNKDVVIWTALGSVDEQLGNDEAALDDYGTALAFDPNNFQAKASSKRIEQKQKEKAAKAKNDDFDLGNYVVEMESEKGLEQALDLNDGMEEVDIFQFDDSVTPGVIEAASEEPVPEEPEKEEDPMETALKNIPETKDVSSMLDFLDDKTFEDKLVENPAEPEKPQENEAPVPEEKVPEENASETEKPEEYGDFKNKPVLAEEEAEQNEKINLAAEKADSAAEKASTAAQHAWEAAQSAADVAQAMGSAEEHFQQIADDAAKNAAEKAGLEAADRLNKIADNLQNQLDEIKKQQEEQKKLNESAAEEIKSEVKFEPFSEEVDPGIPREIDEEIIEPENEELPVPENENSSFADGGDENLDGSELDDLLAFVQDETTESTEPEQIVEEDQTKDVPEDFSEPETENVPESEPESENEPEDAVLPEEEDSNEKLLSDVEKILPKIASMLENKEDAEKFKKEITLFQQLRAMGEFLPEDKREEFLLGKTRLLLDFLIARLSGRPGLLKTVDTLRESGVFEGVLSEENASAENLSVDEMAVEVLNQMKKLALELPDPTMGKALIKLAESV